MRTARLQLAPLLVGSRSPRAPAQPCRTMSPPPAATSAPAAAAATTRPIPSAGARRPLLIDTDVAGDDLVALAFLLSSPSVELVGITVSGTGEAHCAGGVDVVLRLLERLDAPDIPVACGRETPLAGSHAFPDDWRERVDQAPASSWGRPTERPAVDGRGAHQRPRGGARVADRADDRAAHQPRRRPDQRPCPGGARRTRLHHGRGAARPGQPGLLRRPRGQRRRRVERVRRPARAQRRRRQRHQAVAWSRSTGRTRYP